MRETNSIEDEGQCIEVPHCEGAEATGVGCEDREGGEPYQHGPRRSGQLYRERLHWRTPEVLLADVPMLDREPGLRMTAANGTEIPNMGSARRSSSSWGRRRVSLGEHESGSGCGECCKS